MPQMTLSEVEDAVNEFAMNYARKKYNAPSHAFRIILWPTDKFIARRERGPTAILRFGILPGHPKFNEVLYRSIEVVVTQHMYDCLEIESVADIIRRESELNRVFRVRELIPYMLPNHEVETHQVTRVEVVHNPTGTREVFEQVELKHGQRPLSIHTMTEIAKARLARRVHEARMKASPENMEKSA